VLPVKLLLAVRRLQTRIERRLQFPAEVTEFEDLPDSSVTSRPFGLLVYAERSILIPARQPAGRQAKVAVGSRSEYRAMRPFAAELFSPADQRRELIRLLATGVRRAVAQAAAARASMPHSAGPHLVTRNPTKTAQDCLEVRGDPRLSVQPG